MEALKNPKIALAWITKGKHGRQRQRDMMENQRNEGETLYKCY